VHSRGEEELELTWVKVAVQSLPKKNGYPGRRSELKTKGASSRENGLGSSCISEQAKKGIIPSHWNESLFANGI